MIRSQSTAGELCTERGGEDDGETCDLDGPELLPEHEPSQEPDFLRA